MIAFAPDATRREALATLRREFSQAALDSPALDARILVAEALGIDATELALRPDHLVGATAAARLSDFARRRLAREPVARILGRHEFWGLEFALSPDTLVPRPDTEIVVEAALSTIADRQAPLRILDLGTGSGCLLTALLHELPSSWGVAVDRSAGAAALARANASRNRVGRRSAFVVGDWGTALHGHFDLIVSNPPYIPRAVLKRLAPEVAQHDPRAALDGGADGLDAYRTILSETGRLLSRGGLLVVEIGVGQEGDVRRLAAQNGLETIRTAADLAGVPRAVLMRSAKLFRVCLTAATDLANPCSDPQIRVRPENLLVACSQTG